MATIKFSGLDEYVLKLRKLEGSTDETLKKAVYAGAKVIADEVKTQLNTLNVTTDKLAMVRHSEGIPTYITERAKDGLIKSFGVAKLETDDKGFVNVKLGFDGYNDVKTKKYPKGQPNNLIARSCESGSSAMIKQPFFRPAVATTKKQAEKAMEDMINNQIKKIIGG